MKRILKGLRFIYRAGDNLVEHDGIEHAGFLSFTAILALFPFLVFFVAILGVFGETDTGRELISNFLENAPPYITTAIWPRINEILNGPPQGLLTISIIGTIWTSSSMVEGLRTTLNRAYRVHTPPNYYWRRFISIIQIVILAVMILVTMLVLILAPLIFEKIYGFAMSFNNASEAIGSEERIHIDFASFSFLGVEWTTIRYTITISVILLFVSMVYYWLPNVAQSWRRTLPGAIVTVLGWILLGQIFSYYLSNFDQVNLVYGSLAGIIAFLLFFYIASIIFIYGAEFNYLLEVALGHKIEEKE